MAVHSKTTGFMTGPEIQAAREALNLSREGLAYKADVAARTIERIELGHTKEPMRATLAVIENALEAEEEAKA